MMSKRSGKLLTFLLILEIYFILPLLFCGLCWVQAARAIRHNEVSKATIYTKLADPFFQLSNTSYKFSRPLLWILQVSPYTDRLMRTAGYANNSALSGVDLLSGIDHLLPLMFKKSKTAGDQRDMNETMAHMRNISPDLTKNMFFLAVETQQPQIREMYKYMKFVNALILASDSIGGNRKEGKFLLLFLNDRELRPGGGFIGSYGIITLGHYSFEGLTVHDVYDADGQLTQHVDPPPAIRTYLQNPNWFLRDSNFSPDFKVNADRAQWFLNKEVQLSGFDGVFGITTTAIQEIIGAYGTVHLPDTNDTITKENFYDKIQQQVELNFFPGSRQKQTTLSSLAQAMLSQFESVPKEKLGSITGELFRKKQLAAYMADENLQRILEEYNWAGRQQIPEGDYLFPVESNLGVNKSNAYVTRLSKYEARYTDNGLKHIYTAEFSNNFFGPFPEKNIYKNYFQLYVPKGAIVNAVLVDGKDTSYEVWNTDYYSAPAVYFEVPPRSKRTLVIIYTTPWTAGTQREKNIYSLTLQKQTGTGDNDFALSVQLPKGSSLLSHDFKAEIRNGVVHYTTTLDEDKRFQMEFTSP